MYLSLGPSCFSLQYHRKGFWSMGSRLDLPSSERGAGQEQAGVFFGSGFEPQLGQALSGQPVRD